MKSRGVLQPKRVLHRNGEGRMKPPSNVPCSTHVGCELTYRAMLWCTNVTNLANKIVFLRNKIVQKAFVRMVGGLYPFCQRARRLFRQSSFVADQASSWYFTSVYRMYWLVVL